MSRFVARRAVKQHSFTVDAPLREVFVLLCPVREYDWIDGWACELVYSASGVAEAGCIFKTNRPGRGEATWVITRHDAGAGAIEFAIVYPGTLVEQLAITLHAEPGSNGESTTRLCWTRTYTGLGPDGNRYIEDELDGNFASGSRVLEQSLNHYLQTGQKLPLDPVH